MKNDIGGLTRSFYQVCDGIGFFVFSVLIGARRAAYWTLERKRVQVGGSVTGVLLGGAVGAVLDGLPAIIGFAAVGGLGFILLAMIVIHYKATVDEQIREEILRKVREELGNLMGDERSREEKQRLYNQFISQSMAPPEAEYYSEHYSRGSDGSVNCFIAATCYGDPNSPEVVLLRRWRDYRLARHRLGRSFIAAYYTWAPPVARLLSHHDTLRTATRYLLDRFCKRLDVPPRPP